MDESLLKRIQLLSPENRKILELYLQNKGINDKNFLSDGDTSEEAGGEPTVKFPEGYYPLSSAQKRQFLVNQIEGPNTTYNITMMLAIEGNLEKERLFKSCKELIKRHESLRTSFELVDGEPAQKIHNEIEFEISCFESEERHVNNLISSFIQPFDLSKAPLFRIGLVKPLENSADTRQVLIIDIHHAISDGASMKIIIKELFGIYFGQKFPELKIQYKEFAAWQNAMIARARGGQNTGERLSTRAGANEIAGIRIIDPENIKKQEEYWLNLFSGEIPCLNLPTDFPRPPLQSFEGDYIGFIIEGELLEKLIKLVSENKVSLFILLLAAFNVLLMRYTGQNDILIGSPIAGRRYAGFDNIVGMFVNTLIMRNYPQGEKTFQEFLWEVRENSFRAYENQDYQFEALVEKLDIRRDLSRNPLFDPMFALQDVSITDLEAPGLKIKPYKFDNPVSKFDITMDCFKVENQILFKLEYCVKLFKKETMERFKGHFINILNEIVKYPEKKLAEIDMLSMEEKRLLISGFNDTRTEYSREKTIHQLFEEQVERTPGNIALICANARGEESRLTYRGLNNKANKLAGELREKGVIPNSIAGIMVERTPEMLIGILGILKAGGAYLPIDPEYPEDRVKYMLTDSRACLLLTQRRIAEKFDFTGNKICLDDKSYTDALKSEDMSNLENISKAGDLAYVIYTSGSTGVPKGVMIEHRAVNNLIKGVAAKIEFQPHKTILAITTVSFDIFVLETLLPLAVGMKIVMADEGLQRDPKALNELIIRCQVDMIQATPSRMQLLMREENSADSLKSLKEIMIGGEQMPQSLLESLEGKRLHPNTRYKIYNMYGPTETTVWSAIKELTGSKNVYIGGPIANTQILILDKYHNIQPIGVGGELYIAGDGLARGYINRPDLTAERFVENPFVEVDASQGTCLQRMYKTGDLARWLPDGSIEFLGRMDYQVKIRGYRIELGEIESALLKHEAVKEAVVVDREDTEGVTGVAGAKYLCAYIVQTLHATSVQATSVQAQDLRVHLLKTLPEYMIPSFFVQLEKLPLTPNGKIDKKALVAPEGMNITGVEYAPPTNEFEEQLVMLWQEILTRDKIGIDDNFFDLGGQSLKATILASRLFQLMKVELPLQEIFKTPTIRQLAKYIEIEKTKQEQLKELEALLEEVEETPENF